MKSDKRGLLKSWSVASKMCGKTSITACLDELKHMLLLLTAKSLVTYFSYGRWVQLKPRWCRHSPAFLTTACWLPALDDKSVTVRWVPLQPTEGQCRGEWGGVGASTVKKKSGSSVGQMPLRCSVGGLQLWLSEKSWEFALSLRARAWSHPKSEEEGNLLCCCDRHWCALLGEGGRRTGGRS